MKKLLVLLLALTLCLPAFAEDAAADPELSEAGEQLLTGLQELLGM